MGLYYNDNGTLKLIAGRGASRNVQKGWVKGTSASSGLNKAIVSFSSPMTTTAYEIIVYCNSYTGTGNVNTNWFITNKTVNGFEIRQRVADPNSTTEINWQYTAFEL